MRNALKTTIVTSILAISIAGAPTLFAATRNNTKAAHSAHMSKTMQGDNSQGNAMDMMNNGDKMPMKKMMAMMAEMNRMMSNCNQMMERMTTGHQKAKTGPEKG